MARTVYMSVEAEIDVEDVLERLDDAELAKVFAKFAPKKGLVVPMGAGQGDPQPNRYVEAAYLVAKSLPDCPQAIKDLFWHVHQRAI